MCCLTGITDGCARHQTEVLPEHVRESRQMSKFIVTSYGLTPDPHAGHRATRSRTTTSLFSEPYNNRMAMFRPASRAAARYREVLPELRSDRREQMAVFIHKAELLPYQPDRA